MFQKAAIFLTQYFTLTSAFVREGELPHLEKFDRKTCYALLTGLLSNGTLDPESHVFFRDNNGQPMSHLESLTLTKDGCKEMCGRQGYYWDLGPRLSTWMIPALLLLSNIELSPIDKRRFFAIIHVVGDPVDSIRSYIAKMEAWSHFYALVGRYGTFQGRERRVIATVLAAFEELEGPCSDYISLFDRIIEVVNPNDEENYKLWSHAARQIADSRTDEFLRTCLAIALYIFQIIGGFVQDVGGGNTSPPGGRIGTALLISWLIPVVLLSNLVGGFTSRRSCYEIIHRFTQKAGVEYTQAQRNSHFEILGHFTKDSPSNYFDALSWQGAIYTYRPWKSVYPSRSTKQGIRGRIEELPWALIIAILALIIPFIGAFSIIWYTIPNGFNCRHIWVILVVAGWMLSAWITRASYTPRFATGKYHWRFMLIKDAVIAVASVLVILLSAVGQFNSCDCWSGRFYYNRRAHVPMNTDPFYEQNDRGRYPIIVGICMFFEVAVVVAIVVWQWNGLQMMRWSELARREEWKNEIGECICPKDGVVLRIARMIGAKWYLRQAEDSKRRCLRCEGAK